MTDDQQRAKELLALGLDEYGHHVEAANVRKGIDLDVYRTELWSITAALHAAPEWHPIDTAPKDERILVRSASGMVYAANWVKNPWTSEEGWLVCAMEDGAQALAPATEWMPLPLAARPQGV